MIKKICCKQIFAFAFKTKKAYNFLQTFDANVTTKCYFQNLTNERSKELLKNV